MPRTPRAALHREGQGSLRSWGSAKGTATLLGGGRKDFWKWRGGETPPPTSPVPSARGQRPAGGPECPRPSLELDSWEELSPTYLRGATVGGAGPRSFEEGSSCGIRGGPSSPQWEAPEDRVEMRQRGSQDAGQFQGVEKPGAGGPWTVFTGGRWSVGLCPTYVASPCFSDRDPPAAGRAQSLVCLLASWALRTLGQC